jgi:hypothetical protein
VLGWPAAATAGTLVGTTVGDALAGDVACKAAFLLTLGLEGVLRAEVTSAEAVVATLDPVNPDREASLGKTRLTTTAPTTIHSRRIASSDAQPREGPPGFCSLRSISFITVFVIPNVLKSWLPTEQCVDFVEKLVRRKRLDQTSVRFGVSRRRRANPEHPSISQNARIVELPRR